MTTNNDTTTRQDQDLQIVDNIVAQLGGIGRLSAMINARDFVRDCRETEVSLMFRFSGTRKANKIRVTYKKGLDLYDLAILKITNHGLDVKDVWVGSMVYGDQLVEIIERETGLLLAL